MFSDLKSFVNNEESFKQEISENMNKRSELEFVVQDLKQKLNDEQMANR